MAIGGAIGVGLFLGSSSAIHDAGPAVIVDYLVAGGIVFLLLRALGEMAMDRPISGSFATYAGDLLGPWAGFTTAWTYWLMWITTVMAETTAVGIYTQYFFPSVPQWVPAFLAVVALVMVNLVSVRWFGEIEFWFALIKIVAIIGFVISGIAIVAAGVSIESHRAAVGNLWAHGGFAPKGILGPLIALQIVTYAFLGVEMIGVTAGEAKNPQRELPRAINRVAWRILIFYLGAMVIILMLIPWDQVSARQSPFVVAWQSLGIPAAAAVLNVVVLAAALSSSNSGIFTTARMMMALADSGQAPRQLSKLSRNRVPARALSVSAVALMFGVLLNVVMPKNAFAYITSVATVAVLWVWAVITITHLRYRQRVRAGELPVSSFRLPGSPWTNIVILCYIASVAVLLVVTPSQRVAVWAALVWAGIMVLGWGVLVLRARRAAPAPAAG